MLGTFFINNEWKDIEIGDNFAYVADDDADLFPNIDEDDPEDNDMTSFIEYCSTH